MIKLEKFFEKKYGAIRGSQTKLAADLKVDKSTVSSWISGRNKPTRDYIKKMAEIFSTTDFVAHNKPAGGSAAGGRSGVR